MKKMLWCLLDQSLPPDERQCHPCEACLLFVYAGDGQSVRKRKRDYVHSCVCEREREIVCERLTK